jgi:hypothetical protein
MSMTQTITPIGPGFFQGTWTVTGSATVKQTYDPLTAGEYLREAVAAAPGIAPPDANSYELAAAAADFLLQLRETSDATSSQNLPLRNAEYAMRGFAGTQLGLLDFKSGADLSNEGGPGSRFTTH